jgi:hypothetical protein
MLARTACRLPIRDRSSESHEAVGTVSLKGKRTGERSTRWAARPLRRAARPRGFFRNAFWNAKRDSNYLSYLDLNGDGVINGFDVGQFRTRLGTMLP